MGLDREFAERVTAAEHDLPGPELLPVRLSRAVAELLPVDGAGLSVFFAADRRLPLGGSDPTSDTAERLQFTVGEGPCLTAHAEGRPLVADERELRSRWPSFYDSLAARTPIRGIVSLPLDGGMAGVGALDLYLEAAHDVRGVSLADALAVTSAVSDTFTAAMAAEPHTEDGPAWLDAPGAGRRSRVWQAIGFVSVGLDLSGPDSLALLRAHAYGTDDDLDALSAAVLERRVALAELAPDTEAAS